MLLMPDPATADPPAGGSPAAGSPAGAVTGRSAGRARPGAMRAVLVPLAAFVTDLVLPVDWPYIATLDHPGLVVAGVAAYLAAGAAALRWRARRPVTVYAAVVAWATLAYVLLPVQPLATVLVALYAVASRVPPRSAALALAAVPVPLGLYAARQMAQPSGSSPGVVLGFSTFFYAFATGAVWLLARQAHRREGRVTELETQHEELARAAVAAERRRLARELHDIVSHAVSVMVLQAAGARRLVPAGAGRGADAGELGEVALALGDIEAQGRQAMVELRRLLGVLRASEHLTAGADVEAVPGDGESDGAGRPGLADLAALTGSIRAAGVDVDVVITGAARPLDPSIDLTAYRLVQEALTNTAKHAGVGAAALVAIAWGDDLVIDVRETGPGTVVAGLDQVATGTGLIGMGERVRALGGRLTAGSADDGTFHVHAVLPVAVTPDDRNCEGSGHDTG
jgi:signal transduction histidine kinase